MHVLLFLHSCHGRHPRLPAALTQLRLGSEHRDGCISKQHAEPLIAARRGDHPQKGGQADEKQVGQQQEKMRIERQQFRDFDICRTFLSFN